MIWRGLSQILSRHALAACCILGPMVLAFAAPQIVALYLIPKLPSISEPPNNVSPSFFRFLPERISSSDEQLGTAVLSSQRQQSEAPGRLRRGADGTSAESIEQRDKSSLLAARDIGGRLQYAVASALLFSVSAAAFLFAAACVAQRLGRAALLGLILAFALIAYLFASYQFAFDRVRPLVVESILGAVDNRDFSNPLLIHGHQTMDLIVRLIKVDTWVALMAVGMLLASLYAVSIRHPEAKLTFSDLLTRREIARWVLGFGSAILVITVLASKVLLNWLLSLLVPSQQLALKPIGDGMTLLLGAMGTIALSSAMAAVIAAFMLDVRRYRDDNARGSVNPQASVELGFAPLASLTGIIAALAPLLISPLLEGLKGLLGD